MRTAHVRKDDATIIYLVSHINGLLLLCDICFFVPRAVTAGQSKCAQLTLTYIQRTEWKVRSEAFISVTMSTVFREVTGV
jgi:hypothetical protein